MANNQVLFGGFKRLADFPLDPSSRFETYDLLEIYLRKNPIAHGGQVLVVYKDSTKDENGNYYRNGAYYVIQNPFEVMRDLQAIKIVDINTFSDELTKNIKIVRDEATNTINSKIEELQKLIEGTTSAADSALADRIKVLEEFKRNLEDPNDKEQTAIEKALKALDEKTQDARDVIDASLEQAKKDLQSNIDTLESKTNGKAEYIEGLLETADAEFEKFKEEVEVIEKNFLERIASLEGKTSVIEKLEKLGEIAEILERMVSTSQENIQIISEKLNMIYKELDGLDTIFQSWLNENKGINDLKSKVENHVSESSVRFINIENALGNLRVSHTEDFTNLKRDLDNLSKDMKNYSLKSELEAELKTTSENILNLDKKISERLDKITEEIMEKTDLNHKDTVSSFDGKTGKKFNEELKLTNIILKVISPSTKDTVVSIISDKQGVIIPNDEIYLGLEVTYEYAVSISIEKDESIYLSGSLGDAVVELSFITTSV